MVLIAHLSDPHLGPLPPMTAAELMSKRLFGYLNWQRNRDRVFDNTVVEALVDDIRAHEPDHIAVTGDLANLGLAAEFDRGRDWLATLGPPDAVTVVPGNHDAYVAGAFAALSHAWQDFMTGDQPDAGFPFVRRRGPLALIGVSTAVATAPLMATGAVGAAQAAALGEALADTGSDHLFRIVLIHHSPVAGSTEWQRRLVDADRVRDAIARHGGELILHGHNHRMSIAALPGPNGPVPIVGAATAARRPRLGRPGGSYNLLRIEGKAGAWSMVVTERRVGKHGDVETGRVKTIGR